MKYIKFDEEVMRVPTAVTFWLEVKHTCCAINMSLLLPQNFYDGHRTNILRSEEYLNVEDANARLDELLELLNK